MVVLLWEKTTKKGASEPIGRKLFEKKWCRI